MPDVLPWAVDNGAFAGFDEDAFVALLDRISGARGCLWVVAPDVVGDSVRTADLFREWEPRIRSYGFPVAFVAQDGLIDPPWHRFDCLFIGGSTEYKLSAPVARLVAVAKSRGKLVHMGRVNSLRRMRYAHDIGVDSIDGTSFSRFGDTWIPGALARMEWLEQQMVLPSERRIDQLIVDAANALIDQHKCGRCHGSGTVVPRDVPGPPPAPRDCPQCPACDGSGLREGER